MALTLTESAKLSNDELQAGVIQQFIQTSPILDRLPFQEIVGNAYAYNEEATLPGVAFRNVNESYTESTGTVNQKTEKLYILGGDADVDKFIATTQSNINDQRATQTAMKVKALSYAYQDTFFNGDSSAKGFDGLAKRLTGDQVLTAKKGGMPIIGDGEKNTIYAFLDKLDELLARVHGIDGTNGALYANAGVIAKIRSAMRHVGLDTILSEDIAGKRALMWNGVPILDAGTGVDGKLVIGNEENATSSQDGTPDVRTGGQCTSIYAVKFSAGAGENGVMGLQSGGIQVNDLGELSEKPVYRTRIEFYNGLAVFGGKAAARLQAVKNA